MKPKLLYIVNNYSFGAIPKILNLIIPNFINSFTIKIISLEKIFNYHLLNQLDKNIEFTSLNMHRLNIFGSIISLKTEIDKFSPDIIHSNLGRSDIYSAICKPSNSKLITTVHTLSKIEYSRGLFNITQIIFRLLDYRFNHKVFISKIVQDSWNNKCHKKIGTIIYNPVAIKQISNTKNHQKKPFKILFVGRLLDFKNAILIVKAIKEIIKTNSNILLSIIGDGPEFDSIKHFVKCNNLDKNVLFFGYCNSVTSFYEETNVIVFPSIWSSGLPLVALEASQHDIALVSSNIKGIREHIENDYNGLLFQSNSHKDLAQKLISLINNPKKIEFLAKNLKNYIDNLFSVDNCSKKYLSIYTELLNNKL